MAVSLPERTDHRDGLILASAVSNIDIQFVDGVRGDTVPKKVLPPGDHDGLSPSTVGSWRAHMNAIAKVVHDNLTSALIMEDDVDWDVRIKPLLKDFAVSSNTLVKTSDVGEIDFNDLMHVSQSSISPYGDNWDLFWLGHCGMTLPEKNRVVHYDDISVPELQHLHSWQPTEITPLNIYPKHTRVVMMESDGVCSLAYAISQRGARKLLYGLGLKSFDAPFDLMLRNWCNGVNGQEHHVCLGVLPQLFDHHRPVGSPTTDSEITEHNEPYREKAYTLNIRWSVRMNMEKILRGETDYIDQYPDEE